MNMTKYNGGMYVSQFMLSHYIPSDEDDEENDQDEDETVKEKKLKNEDIQ